jgi:hypothetical protein
MTFGTFNTTTHGIRRGEEKLRRKCEGQRNWQQPIQKKSTRLSVVNNNREVQRRMRQVHSRDEIKNDLSTASEYRKSISFI